MGYMGDWYPVLRAAKYLGVAPWDLLEQNPLWVQWALDAETAENKTQENQRIRVKGRRAK
jgi:hypothetical protein